MPPIFQRQSLEVAGNEDFQCGTFRHGAGAFNNFTAKSASFFFCATVSLGISSSHMKNLLTVAEARLRMY